MSEAPIGIDMPELKKLIGIDGNIKELNEQLSQLKGKRAELEARLAEQFSLSGVSSLNVDGQTCYQHTDKYISAKPEHRHELVQWAEESGLDEFVALQPARFKNWCKEQLETEQGLPAEIIDKVNMGERVSLRVRRS